MRMVACVCVCVCVCVFVHKCMDGDDQEWCVRVCELLFYFAVYFYPAGPCLPCRPVLQQHEPES